MQIGLARTSTEDSRQDTSLERQISQLKTAGCDLVLSDRESGTHDRRPGYQKLLSFIKEGHVVKVMATRLDRISRDQAELDYFFRLCESYGVSWAFLEQPQYNSDSPYGQEQRERAQSEAALESKRISVRQKNRYDYDQDKLNVWARVAPLGLRIVNRRYEIDDLLPDLSNVIAHEQNNPLASADLARNLIQLYIQRGALTSALSQWKVWLQALTPSADLKLQEKFKKLMTFAPSSMSYWLELPELQGCTVYGKYKLEYYGEKLQRKRYKLQPKHEWHIIPATHPALICPADAAVIERQLQINANVGRALQQARRDPSVPKPLSSIIRCTCGRLALESSTFQKGKRYSYLYCCGRATKACNTKGLSLSKARQQLIQHLTAKANEMVDTATATAAGAMYTEPANLAFLKSEAADAKHKYDLFGLPEHLSMYKSFTQKIELIEAQQDILRKQEVDKQALLMSLSNPQFWDSLEPVELHDLLRSLIREARLENGSIAAIEIS